MLSDQVTQLLTAYVDGELSQRQRKAIMRLLHRSSEAREMLRQLQENVHRLRQLPRRKLPASLANDVLHTIAEQQLQPLQLATPVEPRRRWAPYTAVIGMAASVLLVLGLLYWASSGPQEQKPQLAENKPVETKAQLPFVAPDHKTTLSPQVPQTPTTQPQPRQPNPMLNPLVAGAFEGFATPIVLPEPLVVASFANFHKDEKVAVQLATELKRDTVMKLDFKVKSNTVAMDRLQAALQGQGMRLIVDADAVKALKRKAQSMLEYLVYAENLTAEEVTRMVHELGQPNTIGKRKEPSPYEKLALSRLAHSEKTKVVRMLGIDLSKPEKGSRPLDPPSRWERNAIVLPVHYGVQPSEALRQFAKLRRRPQIGTVQLLIKIREG